MQQVHYIMKVTMLQNGKLRLKLHENPELSPEGAVSVLISAADRKVYVTFIVRGGEDPESLEITIRDKGVGFEPNEVEEPKIEEKLKATRKRGWGLKIIDGLMDEVEIRSDTAGTAIVMRKYR